MSGSSESDPSHRSGGDSDREGLVVPSHELELQDTRKRHHKIQKSGKELVLQGEITTNLPHNDTSMDGDADDDAKVQNAISQLEAALGAKFECLLGKMLTNVKYLFDVG